MLTLILSVNRPLPTLLRVADRVLLMWVKQTAAVCKHQLVAQISGFVGLGLICRRRRLRQLRQKALVIVKILEVDK